MQQKNRNPNSGTRVIVVAILAATLLTGCQQDRNEKISGVYEMKADPTPENVARLRALLDDRDRDVRATALSALVSLRVEDAAELARAALEDPDGFVRATAAKLLGDLDDRADADRLVRLAASDADPVVRQRAVEALHRIGGQAAVEGLIRALSDPIDDVRLAAARGVRELDPSAAKPQLARLLLEDPHHEIRVQAARALGTTGDPEMRPLLEAALEDRNEFVRAAAANALRTHQAVQERRAEPEEPTDP
jgi:HEAT repeat protein